MDTLISSEDALVYRVSYIVLEGNLDISKIRKLPSGTSSKTLNSTEFLFFCHGSIFVRLSHWSSTFVNNMLASRGPSAAATTCWSRPRMCYLASVLLLASHVVASTLQWPQSWFRPHKLELYFSYLQSFQIQYFTQYSSQAMQLSILACHHRRKIFLRFLFTSHFTSLLFSFILPTYFWEKKVFKLLREALFKHLGFRHGSWTE